MKSLNKKEVIDYVEFPDLSESKYISAAEKINEILHNAGINKNKRARFISGLILSLALDSEVNLRENDITTLVDNINALIKQNLREVEKENFFDFLKLELLPSQENHIKYKQAIVETLKEIQTLNIKNAMASDKDILGEFYEKFLKYGNGAKEIGIVLTPRHITKFAVDVLDIKPNDYIFDPACGTGGFLISAFDHIINTASEKQIDEFKNNHIFGIEQDDEVVALAIVNMIFRWNGRNSINEGNCFQKNIEKTNKENVIGGIFVKRYDNSPRNPIITKVMMNPPFALKRGDEKESNFIDYALSQMQYGGTLFVIVPISVMVEGSGKKWRKKLLENNTLLSVVTFPEDLFYPVSVGTVGVFIKKGIPHNFKHQKVYFARAIFDGFRRKKGKRVKVTSFENRLPEISNELKAFIVNQNLKFNDAAEFKKICNLDEDDKNVELVPEIYIDSKVPTIKEIENRLDNAIKNSLAFLIKEKAWRNIYNKEYCNMKLMHVVYVEKLQEDGLCNICKKIALPQNALDEGNVPYVTTSSLNNGVSGYYEDKPNFKGKFLKVVLNGSVGETFFQIDNFITSGDNAVLTLKGEYNPCLLFYIGVMIKNHQWRYNYYRKLNLFKLKKMEIHMPYKNGSIDLSYIKKLVENSYGFEELKKYL